MKGYFQTIYDMTVGHDYSEDVDSFMLGFFTIMAPIGVPLHYIGIIVSLVMGGNNE